MILKNVIYIYVFINIHIYNRSKAINDIIKNKMIYIYIIINYICYKHIYYKKSLDYISRYEKNFIY